MTHAPLVLAPSVVTLAILLAACGPTTTGKGSETPASTTTASSGAVEAPPGGDATRAPDVRVLPTPGASDYPTQTVGYQECWNGLSIEDDADADYAEILAACGKPTGMLPVVAPVRGELGPTHKSDKLVVPLKKGMCYRFVAVGNQSLGDVDVRIEKSDGALVAVDKTSHPVAIIEGDKPWCVDEDVQWSFVIEVDGNGHGHYVFGVLGKPK